MPQKRKGKEAQWGGGGGVLILEQVGYASPRTEWMGKQADRRHTATVDIDNNG